MAAPSRPRGTAATAGDVLALIRSGRATTRAGVGRATGLSRTAVTARLAALLRAGLVVEGEDAPSTGGRPPAALQFDPGAGVVLALAVGRSRTQVAVCDLDAGPLATDVVEQEPGIGPDELMPRAVEALAALLAAAGRDPSEVWATGVSVPGAVDAARGAVIDSPVVRGWDDVPLAPYLRPLGGSAVVVDNDANALALSERQGHLREHSDVIMIKASTGLGAGLVLGGRLLRGARGAAGELGHTRTPDAAGLRCRCGETGCLEAVAGGWALLRDLDGHPRVEHLRDLVALAVAGEPEARRLVRRSGRAVGVVLAEAVNLLNPQAVVVGGDMAPVYEQFVAGLRETLYASATGLATRDLQILPSTHGEASGVVGCAEAALEAVLSPEAVDRMLRGRP